MAVAPALTPWLRSRWGRFDGPLRLAGIDLARGVAVIGMLAAHLLWIDDLVVSDPSTWLDVVNGRSSILFATLAGVSIALVTGGREPVRGAARARASARIVLRAAFLWLLGLLLLGTGVPVYVILPAYAMLFALSLPFLGLGPRALFLLAGGLGVVLPFLQVFLDAWPLWATPRGDELSALVGWHYPFTTWIVFLLAGMAAGRCDLRSLRVAALLLAGGGLLAVVGYGLAAVTDVDAAALDATWFERAWTAGAHSSGVLEVVGSGGFALAAIGASLLACRTPLRWIAVPLRAVGSMPLTAYTAQLVIWAGVAASVLGRPGDLVGFRDLEPFGPLTAGIVLACTLWAIFVGRGPLEAVIDRVSRWVVPEPPSLRPVDRLDG